MLDEVVHPPKMLWEKRLPSFKVCGQRRFRCEDIARWIDNQQQEGTEVDSNE